MDQHETLLQRLAGPPPDLGLTIDVMVGQESAAADAELGIAVPGRPAFDHFDARPDAAGVLPAAARAGQPFAEDRPGRDDAPLRLVQGSVERLDLAGRPHAGGDDGRQQIGGDGQPRPLGNVVDLAHDLQPEPRADQPLQHLGEALPRALQPRRHDPGRDRPAFKSPR